MLKPLSIFLVAQGDTKGDRMLFMYPIGDEIELDANVLKGPKLSRNPCGFVPFNDDVFMVYSRKNPQSCIKEGHLAGLPEHILAFIFTAKPEMCGQKFEIKINDVRFVSHPILLSSAVKTPHNSGSSDKGVNRDDSMPHILIFNVVFALRAEAPRSVAACYHDLSKRIGLALKYEEARSDYLVHETKIMVECHEEVQSMPEDSRVSPYKLILQKSQLARDLPEDIEQCLAALRPYHGMLLLEEATTIIDSLPLDASPALVRLLKTYHPSRSLQSSATEADLPLSQVFQLAGHLVYWGKATVIYPLCETNVYFVSPSVDLCSQQLAEAFSRKFSAHNLWSVLSEFSLPISLGDFAVQRTFDPVEQTERIQMVTWLLQHHLLMQLYTYVYICVEGQNLVGCSAHVTPLFPFEGNNLFEVDSALHQELTANLTALEYSAVLAAALNIEDLTLFAKMCCYFRGQHSVEEMMYCKNLKRAQVSALIGRFSDVLITCVHEDQLEAALHHQL